MNSFNDIKDLWQNQPDVKGPDVETIKKAANKTRRQMITKNVFVLVSLGAALSVVICISFLAEFKYTTTKLGIVLVVISVVGAMMLSSQLLWLLWSSANNTLSNQAYLQQLISYRNKQRYFQSKGMVAYFILLSIGMALYLYEFCSTSLIFAFECYFSTFAWIAFAWFYLRPRAIKKEEEKINDLIEQMQSISGQLEK